MLSKLLSRKSNLDKSDPFHLRYECTIRTIIQIIINVTSMTRVRYAKVKVKTKLIR